MDQFSNYKFIYREFIYRDDCREYNKDAYARFIDLQKAFDRVKHEKPIKKKKNKDVRVIRIIKNLYWNQKASVRIEDINRDKELKLKKEYVRGVFCRHTYVICIHF